MAQSLQEWVDTEVQSIRDQRFSQIRYGSQVDFIIPLSERFRFIPVLKAGVHVKAGVDPLITIEPKD